MEKRAVAKQLLNLKQRRTSSCRRKLLLMWAGSAARLFRDQRIATGLMIACTPPGMRK